MQKLICMLIFLGHVKSSLAPKDCHPNVFTSTATTTPTLLLARVDY